MQMSAADKVQRDGADAIAIPRADVDNNVDLARDQSFLWYDVRAISLGLVLLCSLVFFLACLGNNLETPRDRSRLVIRSLLWWLCPVFSFRSADREANCLELFV